MDAEPPRCTLQDAKSQEVLHGRAMLRPHREAPGTKRIGKRSAPVTHQLRLRAGLGEMHRERAPFADARSEEHTSELQSHSDLVCRLLLEKKNNHNNSKVLCTFR